MYLSRAVILYHLFSVFTHGMPPQKKQVWYPKKRTTSPEGSPPDTALSPASASLSAQSGDILAQQTEAQTEPSLPETLEMRDLFEEYKPYASSSQLHESRDTRTRTPTSPEIPTYQLFQSPLPFGGDPSVTATQQNRPPFGLPNESADPSSLSQLSQRYHNLPTLISPLPKSASGTSALHASAKSYQPFQQESQLTRPDRENYKDYLAQKHRELQEFRSQYENFFASASVQRTDEPANQASPWSTDDTRHEAKLYQKYSPPRSEPEWGGSSALPFKQPATHRDSFSSLVLQEPHPSKGDGNQEPVGQPQYFGVEQPFATYQQSQQPWLMNVNNMPTPAVTQSRNADQTAPRVHDQSGSSLSSQPYWQNLGSDSLRPRTDTYQLFQSSYSEPINSPSGNAGAPFNPFGDNAQPALPSNSEAQHSLFSYSLFPTTAGRTDSTVVTSGGDTHRQPSEGEADLIFPWDEVAPSSENNPSRKGTDEGPDYFLPDILEADPGTRQHIPTLQHDQHPGGKGSKFHQLRGESGQPSLRKASTPESDRISSIIQTSSDELSTSIKRPPFAPTEPTESLREGTGSQFFPTRLQGQQSEGVGSNTPQAVDEAVQPLSSKLPSPSRFSPPGSEKGASSPPYRPSPLGSPNRYSSATQQPLTQTTMSIGKSESLQSGQTLQQHQLFEGVESSIQYTGDEQAQSPPSKLSSPPRFSPPGSGKGASSPPNRQSPSSFPDQHRSITPLPSTQPTMPFEKSGDLQRGQTLQQNQLFEGVGSNIYRPEDELAQLPSSKSSSPPSFSPPGSVTGVSSPPNRRSPLGSPDRNRSVQQQPSTQPTMSIKESEKLPQRQQQFEGAGSNFYPAGEGRKLSPVSKLSFPPGFGPPGSLKRVSPTNRPSPLGSPNKDRSVTQPPSTLSMESTAGKESSKSALKLQQDQQSEGIGSNIQLAGDELALPSLVKQSSPPGFGTRASPIGSPLKNTSPLQPLSTESIGEGGTSQPAVKLHQNQQSEGSEPAQLPVRKQLASNLRPSPFTTTDLTRPVLSLPSAKPTESILKLPFARTTEPILQSPGPILAPNAHQQAEEEQPSTRHARSGVYQPPKSKAFSPPKSENVTSSSPRSLLLKSADPYKPPMRSSLKESRLAKLLDREDSSFDLEGPAWSTISSTCTEFPDLQRRRERMKRGLSISIDKNELPWPTITGDAEESRVSPSDVTSKANTASKYIIPAFKSKVSSNLRDKDSESVGANAPPSVSPLQQKRQPRKEGERNSPPELTSEQSEPSQISPKEFPDRAMPTGERASNPKVQSQPSGLEAPVYSLFPTSQRSVPDPQSISTSRAIEQTKNANLPGAGPTQEAMIRFGSITDPVIPRKVFDDAVLSRPDFSLFTSNFQDTPVYHQFPQAAPTNESQDPEYVLFPSRERIPREVGKEILKSSSTLKPRGREEETSNETTRNVLQGSRQMQHLATPHTGRETDITYRQPTQHHALQFGNIKMLQQGGKFVPSPPNSSSLTPSASRYSKLTELEMELRGIPDRVSASKKPISPETSSRKDILYPHEQFNAPPAATSSRKDIFYPHEQFKPLPPETSDSGKVLSRADTGQPSTTSTPLSFKQMLCQGSRAESSAKGGEDIVPGAEALKPASPDASPPFSSFFSSWPISAAGQPLPVLSFSEIVRRNKEKKMQDLRPARGREQRGKKKVTREDTTGRQSGGNRVLPDEYPRENCVLIVPRMYSADFDIVEEIQRLNVPFVLEREAVPFPTGSLLILCNSPEEAAYLKRIVAKSDTLKNAKEQKMHPRQARILGLGSDVARASVIQHSIESAYGETPRNLLLHRQERNDKSLATMEVSANLLKQMESNPNIEIQGRKFKVDTSIVVDRCEKCKLLGHHGMHCGNQRRAAPSKGEPCVDCTHVNKQFEEFDKVKKRSVEHRTGDPHCPTRLYYERKWKRCQLPYDKMKEEGDVDTGPIDK